PPPPPLVAARTMPQRLGRLEEVQGLRRDLMDASGLTYQAFDGTFRGSSPAAFRRRTRNGYSKRKPKTTKAEHGMEKTKPNQARDGKVKVKSQPHEEIIT
ncbi:hypothetical protein Tco_0818537, partial [Tanacetum coccineum]